MNIKIKVMALLLSFVILAGIAVVSACDTRTPADWKNHTWKIGSSFTYTDETSPCAGHPWTIPEWFTQATFQTPVKGGDAKINLEQKVIAAILNKSR